jgi:hypothetical protein
MPIPEATNAARKVTLEVGRVDIANLREVWTILLAPETEELFLSADYYPNPKGVVPTLAPAAAERRTIGSMGWNSGQTPLSWSCSGTMTS